MARQIINGKLRKDNNGLLNLYVVCVIDNYFKYYSNLYYKEEVCFPFLPTIGIMDLDDNFSCVVLQIFLGK